MKLQFSVLSPTHPGKVFLQRGGARLQDRRHDKPGTAFVRGFRFLPLGSSKCPPQEHRGVGARAVQGASYAPALLTTSCPGEREFIDGGGGGGGRFASC